MVQNIDIDLKETNNLIGDGAGVCCFCRNLVRLFRLSWSGTARPCVVRHEWDAILIISSEFRSQASYLWVPEFSQQLPIARSAPNSGSCGRVGPELEGTVTSVIV